MIAGLLLAPDNLVDALLQERVEGLAVHGKAVLHRLDVLDELRRADEAAHVRGEDAIGVSGHGDHPYGPVIPEVEEGSAPRV